VPLKMKVDERKKAASKLVQRIMRDYICCHGAWNTEKIMELAIRKLKGEVDVLKKRRQSEARAERKVRSRRRRVPKVAESDRKDVPNAARPSGRRHGVKSRKNSKLSRDMPPDV